MKTFIITLVLVCVAATAGTILYLNSRKVPPSFVTVAESSPTPAEPTLPEPIVVFKPEPLWVISENAGEPTPAPVSTPASESLKPATASTPHSKAGDTLVSAQTSYGDRWALLKKLKKLGQLDAAITELKQRAADDPDDAGIHVALGEAIMSKFPIQNYNEAAMLGLQIDQSFNAALKLDPANWEAQYSKANALAGWPPEMNTGPEVIQRLSNLVDQQETMPSQPHFAQTYVLLGEQYQKAGKPDYAQTTWQLGLAKFPNDSTLRKKIANP